MSDYGDRSVTEHLTEAGRKGILAKGLTPGVHVDWSERIGLYPDQIEWLNKKATRESKSTSLIVRELIDKARAA